MPAGKCYIGTSGWSYTHWAKGRFYPKGSKPGEYLKFFAGHFNTVELNASFYRLPKPEVVSRWRQVTSPRFRFAVKLWRRITHVKRLVDSQRELGDFFDAVGQLGPKRGPLLVQLPPSMKKETERLDAFLAELESVSGRARWKVVVEFRNTAWLCDEMYDLLTRYGAALCLADMARCPITEPNDASFVYVRRHGPGGRYRGCYSSSQITADAQRVHEWLRGGKDVFVYYNNDVDGHAVDNACQLIDAVGC